MTYRHGWLADAPIQIAFSALADGREIVHTEEILAETWNALDTRERNSRLHALLGELADNLRRDLTREGR